MPGERQPSRPIEAYKAIIDQLVTETSHGVNERLVREQGIFRGARDEQGIHAFVQSLTTEQRSTLAQMLQTERIGAIHDVLAVFTWWILARKVGLTFRGEAMPVELSGMGLHGDYIGRLGDWEWPGDGDPA
ncbi:MAG: hypothetical protein LAO78_01165 [Acidobacteriia bacterium]|nr:hypothetical protein [Terriglobia bacterium]